MHFTGNALNGSQEEPGDKDSMTTLLQGRRQCDEAKIKTWYEKLQVQKYRNKEL
jgi:hypothetical protein